jgi:hypothetical protein
MGTPFARDAHPIQALPFRRVSGEVIHEYVVSGGVNLDITSRWHESLYPDLARKNGNKIDECSPQVEEFALRCMTADTNGNRRWNVALT